MTKTDFRKQVKTLLEKTKMSVPKLARQTELNQQTIYNYLAGRTEMTAKNLGKIIDVLS